MKETLTADRALELLDKVVAERGEGYVYQRPEVFATKFVAADGQIQSVPHCMYSHVSAPGCIVGAVLHADGWTMQEIHQLDGKGTIGTLATLGLVNLTDDAQKILAFAQESQDNGQPWGIARDHARAWANGR